MSLLGLYQIDPSLFDNLELPEGLESDVLINNMLAELAELEVIYPDPVFMKASIGFWSKKQLNVWTELYATLLYEYNPIWNKDYTETEERDLAGTEDVTDGNSHSHDVTSTRNLTSSHDVTTTRDLANSHDVTTTRNLAHTDDSTTTESVYGFNSSTAADANKTVFDNDTSDTGTIRDAGSGSDTGTIRDAGTGSDTGTIRDAGTSSDDRTIDRDTTDTGTITRTGQGNIGIATTQSLIREQREVVQFNVYDYIIADFKKRFCLMVY
jgi:hypothetical protein